MSMVAETAANCNGLSTFDCTIDNYDIIGINLHHPLQDGTSIGLVIPVTK